MVGQNDMDREAQMPVFDTVDESVDVLGIEIWNMSSSLDDMVHDRFSILAKDLGLRIFDQADHYFSFRLLVVDIVRTTVGVYALDRAVHGRDTAPNDSWIRALLDDREIPRLASKWAWLRRGTSTSAVNDILRDALVLSFEQLYE
jgi:hypothetical protein